MKLIQTDGVFVIQKFKTTVIRLDYDNIDNMDQEPFSILINMNTNEILEDLDELKTSNLIRNFSEFIIPEIERRLKAGEDLSENYYYHDNIEIKWVQKQYDGGVKGKLIIINN